MRILHLIKSEGVYGAERILLYLAREQQRAGDTPVIGNIAVPGTPPTVLEQLAGRLGLAVAPLRVGRVPTPRAVRTLLGAARDLNADLVHSHGYKANILLGPVSGTRRPRMISTLHGWSGSPPLTALWLYEQLDRRALRCIDSIVVVAREMLELPAVRSLDPGRVRVIENGIPDRAQRLADPLEVADDAQLRSCQEFIRRKPTFVAIGRLSPEKGFRQLLEAFAASDGFRRGTHQLLIVGAGPQLTELKQQAAAAGLEGAVLLSGFVPQPDRLLAEAAGFVISSLTEGMPLVLLEALQWPVPVLATRVGAIPQLLQEAGRGRVVPAGEVSALAGGLDALARDPAGVGALPQRYSAARMASEYRKAYGALA